MLFGFLMGLAVLVGTSQAGKKGFLAVPLPTQFGPYDVIERDGFISLAELIKVTEARENVELAFNASDSNGDGLLSEEEFNAAPWMLQGDPAANNINFTEMEESFKSQPPVPKSLQKTKLD